MLRRGVPTEHNNLKGSRVGKFLSAAKGNETEKYETPRLSAKFKVRNGTH